MIQIPFPFLSSLPLVFCLVACVPSAPTGSRPTVVSENLAGVKMPVLRSAYFEKNWGKPDTQVMDDGTYRLRYRQGTTLNFVIIESKTKLAVAPKTAPAWEEPYAGPDEPTPAPHQQSWKYTTILGQAVKWYQADGGGGADFPGYETVDFQLTSADGKTGIYQVTVCSDTEEKAADWISRVGW